MHPTIIFAATALLNANVQARVTTGTVLVANQQSASATIIDVATQTATTIEVGMGPHEAVISPDGRWGIVTIYGVGGPNGAGNKLSVIDLAAKKVVRTVDLGIYTRPHGASFIPGSPNLVSVTSESTQNFVIADIVKGEVVTAIPTRHPGSHMLGVTADGKRAYTANMPWGGISEFDLERRVFTRDLVVASNTEGVAVAPDGSTVWLGSNDRGTVSVVDTKTWTVATTITGFTMPYRLAFSPNGSLAVVCDPEAGKIGVVDAVTRKVLGEVTGLASPRGVNVASDNRTAFVTLGTEHAVVAVDLVDRRVLWKVPVGMSPDGVWYGPKPAGSP
jgi:YVTN family beta-propeller protein